MSNKKTKRIPLTVHQQALRRVRRAYLKKTVGQLMNIRFIYKAAIERTESLPPDQRGVDLEEVKAFNDHRVSAYEHVDIISKIIDEREAKVSSKDIVITANAPIYTTIRHSRQP